MLELITLLFFFLLCLSLNFSVQKNCLPMSEEFAKLFYFDSKNLDFDRYIFLFACCHSIFCQNYFVDKQLFSFISFRTKIMKNKNLPRFFLTNAFCVLLYLGLVCKKLSTDNFAEDKRINFIL